MFLQWLSSSQLYCWYFTSKPLIHWRLKKQNFFALWCNLPWASPYSSKMGGETVRLMSAQFSWLIHIWLNQSSLSSVPVWERGRVLHLFNHVRACWIHLKSYRTWALVGCRNGLLAVYIMVWCNNNTHKIHLNLSQGRFLLQHLIF